MEGARLVVRKVIGSLTFMFASKAIEMGIIMGIGRRG
jgi:hypothetical protein